VVGRVEGLGEGSIGTAGGGPRPPVEGEVEHVAGNGSGWPPAAATLASY
jgi:hypothetical protein